MPIDIFEAYPFICARNSTNTRQKQRISLSLLLVEKVENNAAEMYTITAKSGMTPKPNHKKTASHIHNKGHQIVRTFGTFHHQMNEQ